MSNDKQKVSIFWFRRDLRLHDNHGLWQALQGEYPVLPIFIFDSDILDRLEDKADKRLVFIHQTLQAMQEQVCLMGSSLHVLFGKAKEQFEHLSTLYDIQAIYTNHDYEPYAIKRDADIKQLCEAKNTLFFSFKDQVIFEKNEVTKDDGSPYTVFTPYSRKWKATFQENTTKAYPSEAISDNFLKKPPKPLPSIEDLGFQSIQIAIPKTEVSDELLQSYEQTRNFPALDSTSKLSVHLRFGTVSIRHLVEVAYKNNETWLNELIWREFFMMILFHFPEVQNRSFRSQYDRIVWRNNESDFEAWKNGQTGYPMVDAGMRELNATGFMHNRVRMVVASFLCKHLLIDWRWGEAYFAQKLLDYDLSANNGNWQWAAGCGCDAAPYFRIFNPHEQLKKFDSKHQYIKKWVPEYGFLGYVPEMVAHDFARKRALETYQKYLKDA